MRPVKNTNKLVLILVATFSIAGFLFFSVAPKASAETPQYGCPGGPIGPGAPASCRYTAEEINQICNDPSSLPDGDSVYCPNGGGGVIEVNNTSSSVSGSGSSTNDNPEDGEGFEAHCNVSGGQRLNQDNCGIIKYIVTFTRVMSGLVGIVIVIMIAVGGVQYTAARDDPQAVSAAKTRIRDAIMALIFYLFGVAFLQYLVPGGIF